MRTRWKVAAGFTAALILVGVVRSPAVHGTSSRSVVPVAAIGGDDAGDKQATTTYDGAMVRKRAAIAIHPGRNADRAHIRAELDAAARQVKAGPLTPATFAVFSEDMLNYLVPEMTFVLPEGVTVEKAEALMRDHQPADVAFYLVEPVLVHDLTFAVVTTDPAGVRRREDAEGILTDSLGKYRTSVQPAGVTVSYFGAILSDPAIDTVKDAMARAAGVPPDRVQVSANEPGPGVDLSNGVPDLSDSPHHHH
jgi:hypothetical protein